MKKLIIVISFGLFGSASMAQNLTFFGFLPAINQTGKITKKINYNFFASTTIDGFDRVINGIDYPATDFQLYIQPSIIYVYSPNLNFAGSYTYQRNNPLNSAFSNEHRLWQQVIFSFPISKGRLINRFRFEERFTQNKTLATYPLSTRFRYQVGFNMPLQGKTLEKNEFYFNTYNEFYFSLTGAKNATFSENWSYVGVGLNLGKMGKIELGYLLQTATRNQQHDLRLFNLAQIMWVSNFNFDKKKK